MKLYIVRHGESIANKNKITQGIYNSRLSKEGITQAKKIAKRLSKEKFDYIYCSDMLRTIKTAKEILKYHPNLYIIKSKLLREQSRGIFDGRPRSIIQKEMKRQNVEWIDFKPKGGESIKQTWKKLILFYNKIKRKHKKDSILIVSHGGPISCLLAYLHDDKVENYRNYAPLDNTSLSIIDIINDNNLKIHKLNCSKHLK